MSFYLALRLRLLLAGALICLFTSGFAQSTLPDSISQAKAMYYRPDLPDSLRLVASKMVVAYYERLQLDSALSWSRRYCALAEAAAPPLVLAQAWLQLGGLYGKTGDMANASIWLQKTLAYADQQHFAQISYKSLNNLGIVAMEQQSQEARYYLQRAIRLGDSLKLCTAPQRTNLAVWYNQHQQPARAYPLLDSAAQIAFAFDDHRSRALVYVNMGNISADPDQKLGSYLKALQITREHTLEAMEAVVSAAIGEIYLEKKNYPKAEEYVTRGVETARKLGQKEYLIRLLRQQAEILADGQNRYKEAHAAIDEAIELSIQTNMKIQLRYCYLRKAAVYHQQKIEKQENIYLEMAEKINS